jgi:hypothetical protein
MMTPTTTITSEELRLRMRAVFSKDSSLTLSKSEKPGLHGYSFDSTSKKTVTSGPGCNRDFSNKNNTVTVLPAFSSDRDGQGEKLRQPSLAHEAVSADPSGATCKVEIVEQPQVPRYRGVFGVLQLRPPAYVPEDRWRQCVKDGSRFLAKWGEQAERLGWSSTDLFGLAPAPSEPAANYRRLSRYDLTGLIWLLEGREVLALTESTASIQNPNTGNVTIYRKRNKPALGPLGDSLEDLK